MNYWLYWHGTFVTMKFEKYMELFAWLNWQQIQGTCDCICMCYGLQ